MVLALYPAEQFRGYTLKVPGAIPVLFYITLIPLF